MDWANYDRIVKQNRENARMEMEAAEKSYRQKVAAHRQTVQAEEDWEKAKEESFARLEERQNVFTRTN